MDLTTVYWVCAVIGGTLLVCQFLFSLIGLGSDHGDGDAGGHDVHFEGADVDDVHVDDVHGGDVHVDDFHGAGDGDHAPQGHSSTTWLFGVLTFRTIVAGMAFFGLTGLSLRRSQSLDSVTAFFVAMAAGGAAIFIVYQVMRALHKLNVDGTVRIKDALGATGTVYLSIPEGESALGKVHVKVGERIMEYSAKSPVGPLPTGEKIVVVAIVGSRLVEVRPVEAEAEVST